MRFNQKGFTLIEVMATLAILAISLVILIKSQTQSVHNVRRVGNFERAVFITENQLHWTFLDLNEAESWEDYASLSGDDNDFLWQVSISPVEMENTSDSKVVMLKVVATTTWPEGRSESQYQLETWYLWGESK